MTEYEIQPLSWRCAQTGRELKPGEMYYSVLRESPQGFIRLDYCAEAWAGPPDGTIGFWRSKVPDGADRQRPQMVEDSVIVEFFERLAEAQEAYKQNFRFILALLLLRKKILKLARSVREGDREVLVLRSATGQEHRVVNPELSEEQLLSLQAEVEKILQCQTYGTGTTV